LKGRNLGGAILEFRNGVFGGGAAGVPPAGFPQDVLELPRSGSSAASPPSFRSLEVPPLPAERPEEESLPSTLPWEGRYDDPEELFLAHRFGWALMLLASGVSDAGLVRLLEMADIWRSSHPCEEGKLGWDSYSVAERLVHWLFLISAAKRRCQLDGELIGRLEASLLEHAEFLLGHLEFRGASTNNHLVNDARALYLAGVCLSDVRLQEAGRKILDFGARNIFTSSGFLREGSTHYHLLLTRAFLEVLWAGRAAGDDELWERLRDSVAAMVRVAAFLQSRDDLALVGDVSPDFPPEFHGGVAAVGARLLGQDSPPLPRERGWHSLFIEDVEAPLTAGSTQNVPRKESYPDAGYHRFVCGDWTLFLYLNPLGYVPSWSHGHADVLGFVLHFRNMPFVVDAGRATYKDNHLGRYGRSGRSHSAVLVDGLEACLAHGHNGYIPAMLPDYYERSPGFSVEEMAGGFRIRVLCRGFERIQPGLAASRIFELAGSRFSVTDEISGTGRHLVETFFHFHPDVKNECFGESAVKCDFPDGSRLALRAEGDGASSAELVRGVGAPNPVGWFSPRYGELVPNETAVWSGRRNLPLCRHYVFEKDD
jgi:hypothetical protein